MTEPHTVPKDTIGRACCTYCRTEFDAVRPRAARSAPSPAIVAVGPLSPALRSRARGETP